MSRVKWFFSTQPNLPHVETNTTQLTWVGLDWVSGLYLCIHILYCEKKLGLFQFFEHFFQ